MSVSAATPVALTEEAWLAAQEERDEPFLEAVNGEFVVRRTGGNLHHAVAHRLANVFETQWPGVVAIAPANWVVCESPFVGRVPDVLVDGRELLTEASYHGVPFAAAEVWTPNNTFKDLVDKRRDYLRAGLPALLELWIDPDLRVHVEWKRPACLDWQVVAAAAGDRPLAVSPGDTGHRSFSLVPDQLLFP